MKVSILGGGIGGLTTAIALGNAGISCEVYESAETFKPVGAGLSLAFNAWKALEYLDLDKQVAEKGYHYSKGKMLTTKGKTLQKLPMDELRKKFNSNAVTIHRHELHDILSKNLGSTVVHFNKKCIRIKQFDNQVQIFFSDGTSAVTDFLIAADGIHSIVRKQLLPDSEERYSGQTCWRGICTSEIPSLDYAVLSETWGLGLRFGIIPLREKHLYWYIVKNSTKAETHWADMTHMQLADLFINFHTPIREIIQNTSDQNIFWNNLNDLEPIKKFAFGNILLLGDAAHATTPNLGQGACMAIEDAATLESLVKKEKDLIKVFKQFEKERIKRTTKIVNTSYQLGKIAQTANPLIASIRNIVFPFLPKSSNEHFFKFLFDVKFE